MAALPRLRPLSILLALGLGLAGCATVGGPPSLGSSPTALVPASAGANPTPYSAALTCLADTARRSGRQSPLIAIGRVDDYTGKLNPTGDGGRQLTQGAALMAMTAFDRAGFPLVERFDTAIPTLELAYVDEGLLTNGAQRKADAPVVGSDYYLAGGVTQLDPAVRSGGLQIALPTGRQRALSADTETVAVGVDLRLVDTRTLKVVDTVSYRQALSSTALGGGFIDLFSGHLLQASGNLGAQAPLQFAVRSLIERGALDLGARLYGLSPDSCLGGGRTLAAQTAGTGPTWKTLR